MFKLWRTFIKWRFIANIVFNKFKGFLSSCIPRKKMTVIIEQGTLQGIHYKTLVSNKPYVSFLGIPYAKPPVGDLRFKPPVKHPGWSGILKAFSVGNMCMQYSFLSNKIAGSEDCLYLNIFVPQEELEEKKAVMVFIHGGAFNNGSASSDFYSPDYLIDENVIIVTINYRLNALGFLNFDIDECPGNMGLKDQLFAIKWVKANISSFGGDNQNITIFGESAGSASVHCHTLSPQSTGLFQKAIMQSGCIFNPWAFNENHRESAFKLAKHLGCEKDNPKEVVQYLLNIPAIDIVNFTKIKGKTDFTNYEFIPSVESEAVSDKFLPAHPEILVKIAPTVPVITGINNMEGLIAFGEYRMRKIINDTEEINELLKSHYTKEIINEVKNFYFNECNLECGTTRLENICHLYSDLYFSKDFHRSYNHSIIQNISPVFCYEFKFDGEINACKNILFSLRPTFQLLKGACHADELSYLFYGRLFGFAPKANSPELKMCRILSKLWTNFAKTGNPNSQDLSFEWSNTSAEEPKYLSLDGDNTCMVNELLNSSRVHFWEKISETVKSQQKL
ncbi:esterase FE4-like isoform X2 [Rhopalosiphum maidis]|uniref:esterase FE4-like isoform X2 n=2 Tax=Rhopalosiphum maidis TaxID=43146 RepID=UPI000EFEB2E9|nr:esterase FE4-like isoform X2 [Rhopalosiphum maidis]